MIAWLDRSASAVGGDGGAGDVARSSGNEERYVKFGDPPGVAEATSRLELEPRVDGKRKPAAREIQIWC